MWPEVLKENALAYFNGQVLLALAKCLSSLLRWKSNLATLIFQVSCFLCVSEC